MPDYLRFRQVIIIIIIILIIEEFNTIIKQKKHNKLYVFIISE